MPVRNYYSLNPGEAIVAEELRRRYRDSSVFFPSKDVGVDLIVIRDLDRARRKAVTLQVKESRYFYNKTRPNSSWHQVSASALEKSNVVDFFVFVTYLLAPRGASAKWQHEFLIVPSGHLTEMAKMKKCGKDGKYSFYFSFDFRPNRVLEVRDGEADYTQCHNTWDALWQAAEV